jgi:hypothetical protein
MVGFKNGGVFGQGQRAGRGDPGGNLKKIPSG